MNTSQHLDGMALDRFRARARAKVVVLSIVGFQTLALMVLLAQGCRPHPVIANQAAVSTNMDVQIVGTNEVTTMSNVLAVSSNSPSAIAPSNAPAAGSNAPLALTNVPAAATNPVPARSAAMTTASNDYTIAQGDTLSRLAKTFHTTVSAIKEANPALDPAHLKIGQKIQMPAGLASSAVTSVTEADNDKSSYMVKSGDSLAKIAAEYGTTVKAIRHLNNLKSTRINAGQKLKVPVKVSMQESLPGTNVSNAGDSAPLPAPSGNTNLAGGKGVN
ncbi:MAG: LysM peptidoglycan-binding domain-containing protein [Limisphaerales bacterium]